MVRGPAYGRREWSQPPSKAWHPPPQNGRNIRPRGDALKKEALLRLIAESGYNIGYAAKKHLATYDIVEDAGVGVALLSGCGHMRAVHPLV